MSEEEEAKRGDAEKRAIGAVSYSVFSTYITYLVADLVLERLLHVRGRGCQA